MAFAAGLLPFPIVDVATQTLIHVYMLEELAELYELRFSRVRAKAYLASLLGSLTTAELGRGALKYLLYMVPVVGPLLGATSMSTTGASVTYAIGQIFIREFESGGTFMDFDPASVTGVSREEGRIIVRELPARPIVDVDVEMDAAPSAEEEEAPASAEAEPTAPARVEEEARPAIVVTEPAPLIVAPEPAIVVAEPPPAIVVEEPASPIVVVEPPPLIVVAEPPPLIVVEEPPPDIVVVEEPVDTSVVDAEPPPAIVAAPSAEARPSAKDDLVVVKGIGPKIAELLATHGITTFAQLAATPVEKLKALLDEAGPRYAVHDPASWPEQGRLLAEGKLEELKALQAEIKP